jgi:hypothetical protein
VHCKCLRRHFHREVNGHKYSIFVMVVFVPVGSYRLASSHSPIAVIIAENSAARIRTVVLRMIPLAKRFWM